MNTIIKISTMIPIRFMNRLIFSIIVCPLWMIVAPSLMLYFLFVGEKQLAEGMRSIYFSILFFFILMIIYRHKVELKTEEHRMWIKDNLKIGSYYIFDSEALLRSEIDAMAFKLRWS